MLRLATLAVLLALPSLAQVDAEVPPYFRGLPSTQKAGWDEFTRVKDGGERIFPDDPKGTTDDRTYLTTFYDSALVVQDGAVRAPAWDDMILISAVPEVGVKEVVLQVRVRGDFDPTAANLGWWTVPAFDIKSWVFPVETRVLAQGDGWTEYWMRWEPAIATSSIDTEYFPFLSYYYIYLGDESVSFDGIRVDDRYRLGLRSECWPEMNSRYQFQQNFVTARMDLAGYDDVASNDLRVMCQGLPFETFGWLLMSQTQDYRPLYGGSYGHLCLGGPVLVHPQVFESGAGGSFQTKLDLTQLPAVQAGETWWFQTFYRDAQALQGPGTNFSDLVGLYFK